MQILRCAILCLLTCNIRVRGQAEHTTNLNANDAVLAKLAHLMSLRENTDQPEPNTPIPEYMKHLYEEFENTVSATNNEDATVWAIRPNNMVWHRHHLKLTFSLSPDLGAEDITRVELFLQRRNYRRLHNCPRHVLIGLCTNRTENCPVLPEVGWRKFRGTEHDADVFNITVAFMQTFNKYNGNFADSYTINVRVMRSYFMHQIYDFGQSSDYRVILLLYKIEPLKLHFFERLVQLDRVRRMNGRGYSCHPHHIPARNQVMRIKRSLPLPRSSPSSQIPLPTSACQKHTWTVPFSRLGWSDWILRPFEYQANYCKGRCTSDQEGSSIRNHAYVKQQYLEVVGLNLHTGPRPHVCCLPSSHSAINVLYRSSVGITLRHFSEMVVDRCMCL